MQVLIVVCTILPIILCKKNPLENWGRKYDFIIIGGGTAGSVLANRLSEIDQWKILLLEAGQQPPFLSAVPSMAQDLQLTMYNWGYMSQAEETIFKGLNNNRMLWSSGKTIGGTSSINYMIYERGNPEDYNRWQKMGNDGWSFKDVLPYFLKSENSKLNLNSKFHSKSGLMSIEYSYSSEESMSFLKAANELGFNITDYNGVNQIGFSYLQSTTKNGIRQTTANAFLEPFLNRNNLEVLLLAEVTKIKIDSTTNRAKFVHFIKNNKMYKVSATKEIILSAGTFNSPKLLMLSGIGPKQMLNRLKIRPIIKDLPVGEILRDHVTYPGLNFITNQSRTLLDNAKKFFMELPNWYMSRKSSFSSLSNFEAVGFVDVNNSSSTRPNVEFLFLNSQIRPIDKSVMNLKDQIFRELYNNTKNKIIWSIYPTLLHTKSRGKLELNSKKPEDVPLLYPNYFSEPEDVRTMIEAIKFVLDMMKTEEFIKMGVVLNPNPVPTCQNLNQDSDEYWECAIRTLTMTGYDQFGTCKMGNDTEAVVDEKLKVHGIKNLRVVDASIIPDVISGRLMGPVMMIAEKAADFVKEAHKKSS